MKKNLLRGMYSSIEIVYNEKSIIKRPITIMISCLQQWQNDKNDIEKKKKKNARCDPEYKHNPMPETI